MFNFEKINRHIENTTTALWEHFPVFIICLAPNKKCFLRRTRRRVICLAYSPNAHNELYSA